MQQAPHYDDVVAEVHAVPGTAQRDLLQQSRGGAPPDCLDPGFGFGKSLAHNVNCSRGLGRCDDLGCPVLVGLSRKSMVGELTRLPVDRRLGSSIAAALAAVARGARIVRVHDVAETVAALRVWQAVARSDELRGAGPGGLARLTQETGWRVDTSGRMVYGDGWGSAPITPEFVMHLGYAAGRVLAQGGRGRPAVLLGKDTRISGYMLESALMAGLLCRRGRRPRHRAPADAGGRLSHPRLAAVRRGGAQRVAQSVRGQRHQVLLRRRQQAAGRDRGSDRGAAGGTDGVRDFGAPGQGVPGGGGSGTLHRVLQEHVPVCPRPQRPETGGRLRQRRGVPHRAARLP